QMAEDNALENFQAELERQTRDLLGNNQGGEAESMATAEAIYAAERHRAAQLGLRSEMLLELATLWLSLDPYRLDETTPSWLRQVVALIVAHRRRSAELAIEFYEEYRS